MQQLKWSSFYSDYSHGILYLLTSIHLILLNFMVFRVSSWTSIEAIHCRGIRRNFTLQDTTIPAVRGVVAVLHMRTYSRPQTLLAARGKVRGITIARKCLECWNALMKERTPHLMTSWHAWHAVYTNYLRYKYRKWILVYVDNLRFLRD